MSLLPSGVKAMGEAGGPGGKATGKVHSPEVRRFASPPAAGMSQRCVGSALSLSRKLPSPTSKASSNLSAPVFLEGASAAAKAMALPSGFHANCWIEVWLLVSCMRFAAGHIEHEDLVVLVGVLNEESDAIS